jgi:hypothetical protein
MKRLLTVERVAWIIGTVVLAGCQSPGGSPETTGRLGVNALWERTDGVGGSAEQRRSAASAFSPDLPGTVITMTALFSSDSGALRCCVKFDPRDARLAQPSGGHLLVLDQLPVGPAHVGRVGIHF